MSLWILRSFPLINLQKMEISSGSGLLKNPAIAPGFVYSHTKDFGMGAYSNIARFMILWPK